MCNSIEPLKSRQPRLQAFLEDLYQGKRLHSSLDCAPPDEFELKCSMY